MFGSTETFDSIALRRQSDRLTVSLLVFVAICLFGPPVEAKYGDGAGEPNDPYQIWTAEQMNTIGANPDDWDKYFKPMADIDLSEYTGTEFNIIGYRVGLLSPDNEPSTGVFDGNGRTISNFNYSSTTEQSYIGIFGYTERATLENLYLIDPNINVERGEYAGSLVGWSQYATIIRCYVQGGSVSGMNEVGGLVGTNYGIFRRIRRELAGKLEK
ncbi:MAG: hypothetical protein ACYSYV_01860 [Planctomycetota bacterium]|jgi:hypothetical protein